MRIKTVQIEGKENTALYECEHCGHPEEGPYYEDSHFLCTIVPNMICSGCGKIAPDEYRPPSLKSSKNSREIL